jgi:hypothetical protein
MTKASAPKSRSSSNGADHPISRKGKKSRKKVASWRRGQQKIDPQRARQIQDALIREHYLQGAPSGVWDGSSQSALERYQADNGWQSKVVPDSRALIKLGLGPDHQHLLNPDSAMTMSTTAEPQNLPAAPSTAPALSQPAAENDLPQRP